MLLSLMREPRARRPRDGLVDQTNRSDRSNHPRRYSVGIGLLLGRAWGRRSVQKLQVVPSLDPGPKFRLNPDSTKGVHRK